MADVLRTTVFLGVVLLGPALVIDCAARGKARAAHVLSGVIAGGLLLFVILVPWMPFLFD